MKDDPILIAAINIIRSKSMMIRRIVMLTFIELFTVMYNDFDKDLFQRACCVRRPFTV